MGEMNDARDSNTITPDNQEALVLVPRRPTEAMLSAASIEAQKPAGWNAVYRNIYRAMIDAAPVLAGDGGSGVEDVAPDNLVGWLSGLADHFDSTGWPNRANGLRRAAIRLARTLPSTQDEADVERVAKRFLTVWYEWGDDTEGMWAALFPDRRAVALRAAITTMTTRPAGGEEVDVRLRMFLEILAAAGGETDASEASWNWINAFCEGQEGRDPDTFNRAIDLGYAHSTHDSDTDQSEVHLTDKGRAYLAALTKPAALPKEGEEAGWTIEHGPLEQPVFLTAGMGWTKHRASALRFARQVDADDMIEANGWENFRVAALSSLPVRSGEVERLRAALERIADGEERLAHRRECDCPACIASAALASTPLKAREEDRG